MRRSCSKSSEGSYRVGVDSPAVCRGCRVPEARCPRSRAWFVCRMRKALPPGPVSKGSIGSVSDGNQAKYENGMLIIWSNLINSHKLTCLFPTATNSDRSIEGDRSLYINIQCVNISSSMPARAYNCKRQHSTKLLLKLKYNEFIYNY